MALNSNSADFPDWLEEAYYERFGASIAQIKEAVGEGLVYSNRAAEVVVSEDGAWFQCNELPLEFAGASGVDCTKSYPSDDESLRLLAEIYERREALIATTNGRVALFVLYSPNGVFDENDMYSFRMEPGNPNVLREWGEFKPTRAPIAFRFSISGGTSTRSEDINNGFVFFLSRVGDINLLVELDVGGRKFADIAPPEAITIQ